MRPDDVENSIKVEKIDGNVARDDRAVIGQDVGKQPTVSICPDNRVG